MTAASGATAAAAAAAIAQATKASGVLIKTDAESFRRILDRMDEPLVVVADRDGLFGPKHEYLTSYKGLAFYLKTKQPIELPGSAEVVTAKSIWMPS